MNTDIRQSEVAYVVTCLRIDDHPHFLLSHHDKWGDWSLVGGHVEPFEHGSWANAAVRELQEEIPPLLHGKDFILIPIFSRPITWGPTPSRSAGNKQTIYWAQFFWMEFLRSPTTLLAAADLANLRLVPQAFLEREPDISQPLRIIRERLSGGLTSIPLAWPQSLSRKDLPQSLL